jgi:CDP-paratose 2-epimerase
MCEEITGNKMNTVYTDENRSGDHIWWIGDTRKFQQHYPDWNYEYDLPALMQEIHAGFEGRI